MSRARQKPALFDDHGPNDGFSEKLAVNSKFAERFENRNRKQDLARARELGLDTAVSSGSDEDSESEDDGAALTFDLDKRVRNTIELIRKKDPRVYDSSVTFFAPPADGEDLQTGSKEVAEEEDQPVPSSKKSKAKKSAASNVLRKQLIDAAERGAEDAFDEDDEDAPTRLSAGDDSRPVKAYDAEQEALRRAFIDTVSKDDATLAEGDLLRKAPKSKSRKGRNDEDEPQVSRDELKLHLRSKDGRGIATHAGELADPDAFLTAFMRTQAWRDDEVPITTGGFRLDTPAEGGAVVDSESDEEAVIAADAFEAKYNFRFEDPTGAQIVTHTRRPEDSMRRKDTTRQDERARRKERKETEKAAAAAEVRRLMNLKRAETKSRMQQVRAIAGNGVDMARLAAVLADELDADFDPATHDLKMAQLFNDEYFGAAELDVGPAVAGRGKERVGAAIGDEKAVDDDADDDEDEDATPAWVFGDGPRPGWAGPSAEELAAGADDGLLAGGVSHGLEVEMEDGEDEAGDPAISGRNRDRGRRQRQKRHMSDVARVRAEVAEEDDAAADGGDPDAVLALGFEDVIAGGLRTRFNYTTVPPDDFGLSTEELLLAEDVELNRYVSLRKLAPYREQPWVVPSKRRRREVAEIRKILQRRAAVTAPTEPSVADIKADSSGELEHGESEPVADAKQPKEHKHRDKQPKEHKKRHRESSKHEEKSSVAPASIQAARFASYNF